MTEASYSIGEVSSLVDVTIHTLRYYEKIGLIQKVNKDNAGRRLYSDKEISLVWFIKRAKQMNFSLDEIKQLILLDASKGSPKKEMRALVKSKLEKIDESLKELTLLKRDLNKLLTDCELSGNKGDFCPILEGMKNEKHG